MSSLPQNKTHPTTVAAYKARMESVVLNKRVLSPSETQCYASAATNPMLTRLTQLAVPSPQRLEALPSRMRTAGASPDRAQLRDRMGSIQFRHVISDEGEEPFSRVSSPQLVGAQSKRKEISTSSDTRDETHTKDVHNEDAKLQLARNSTEERLIRDEPFLTAFSPHKFGRISPSPNSFTYLSADEKRERLRVVSPEARHYVCNHRERFSPSRLSPQLAYAVYGTAMKDADVWGAEGQGASPNASSSQMNHYRFAGMSLTTEEQIRSILRSEKRKTASTISHEHYTILRNLFEEIDEDGSGYLELRELLQFRAQFPKRLPETVLHGLKLEQDGKVYLDDFLSTFYPCVTQESTEQLMNAFEPKAKNLASVSATALRELNAYYTELRHRYWDFTLQNFATRKGPFDVAREHARQLRRCRRRAGKTALAADNYLENKDCPAGFAHLKSQTQSTRGEYEDIAVKRNALAYHLWVYKRRHRRHPHLEGCPYAKHTTQIAHQRSVRELRGKKKWTVRRRVHTESSDRKNSELSDASGSDTDTSAISTSSCSCANSDIEYDGSLNVGVRSGSDSVSVRDHAVDTAGRCHGVLNAYQWYLHEASVLSKTKGDSTIGAFIAKLRMREVPLKPSVPLTLRAHLSSARPSSAVADRRGSLASRFRRAVSTLRNEKRSEDSSQSRLIPESKRTDGEVNRDDSTSLGVFDKRGINGLSFEMTPFVDGDTTVPNIPYLLACPVSLRDFARVAMDYSMLKEANQPTYHYDTLLSERVDGLRWHKMFPYTGDVRHFFRRFSEEAETELDADGGRSKIPQHIRRGTADLRKRPLRVRDTPLK